MHVYRALGDTIGSEEARALAARLVAWHDAMVKHLRRLRLAGAACVDDCPHHEARRLWTEARSVFGDEAGRLTFLRASGASAARDAPTIGYGFPFAARESPAARGSARLPPRPGRHPPP